MCSGKGVEIGVQQSPIFSYRFPLFQCREKLPEIPVVIAACALDGNTAQFQRMAIDIGAALGAQAEPVTGLLCRTRFLFVCEIKPAFLRVKANAPGVTFCRKTFL